MNSTTRMIVAVAVIFALLDAAGVAYLGRTLARDISRRNSDDDEARERELERYRTALRDEMKARFEAQDKATAVARGAIEDKVKTATTLATKALAKPPASVLVPGAHPIPVEVVGGTPKPAPSPTMMPDTNPRHGGWFSR